jgi:hypothetical protein
MGGFPPLDCTTARHMMKQFSLEGNGGGSMGGPVPENDEAADGAAAYLEWGSGSFD